MGWLYAGTGYTLHKVLGKGGMGLAALVQKRLPFADVVSIENYSVWKVPLAERLTDPEKGMEDFAKEASALSGLNEPNVVYMEGVGVLPPEASRVLNIRSTAVPFIEMEYLGGGDLHSFIRMHKGLDIAMPSHVVAHIMQGIARGCQQAYDARKLIHRDLCPQNVGFLANGQVKVMDYGIAVAAATKEASFLHNFAGKPSYASPEQVAGPLGLYGIPDGEDLSRTRRRLLSSLTMASDIYTLGLIGYEMAHFVNPVRESGFSSGFLARLQSATDVRIKFSKDMKFRPEIHHKDDYLHAVIERCLQYDKSARYSSHSELISDLDFMVQDFQWDRFTSYFTNVRRAHGYLKGDPELRDYVTDTPPNLAYLVGESVESLNHFRGGSQDPKLMGPIAKKDLETKGFKYVTPDDFFAEHLFHVNSETHPAILVPAGFYGL